MFRTTICLSLAAITAVLGGVAHGDIPEEPQFWVARYNGPANTDDTASSVAISPDGSRAYVTGRSNGVGTSGDYATVAYSTSTGNQFWVARYNGPANSSDIPSSVAVSADGSRIFVTGSSPGTGTSSDMATIAYSANTGEELWVARYNGPGNFEDAASAIVTSNDGSSIFVTGQSYGFGSFTDYATIAYSAASGSELWVARYKGPGTYDNPTSIALDSFGSIVYVTGRSNRGGANDYATVAYSATTGTQLWITRYNGPGYDNASAAAVSPDGSTVFVTGDSVGPSGSYDYVTVAYTAISGNQLWVARYNGSSNSYDLPSSLAVSPDGTRLFVTGRSVGLGLSSDYATLSYSAATGEQQWLTLHNRQNPLANLNDAAPDLVVSPDGARLFVTGQSGSCCGAAVGLGSFSDFSTIAYSAGTGTRLWAARYNGPANLDDFAVAVAISPDGSRIFVTGSSIGVGSSSDFATIAYPATSCSAGQDEGGPLSGALHEMVEPQTGPAAPFFHGVNCGVVRPAGL